MILLFFIGYLLSWAGTAFFLTWASEKLTDYLPWDSVFEDSAIRTIMCIIWPVTIPWFFIQIGCMAIEKNLNEKDKGE
jgi:hypothetical protein